MRARDEADAEEAERHCADQLNQFRADDHAAERHVDDGAEYEPAGYDRADPS
jgi:hypothetical protein